MIIHKDFSGGNIKIVEQNGNVIKLDNELRDTPRDWFYWAFCIEGAEGKTVRFEFPPIRLGYYGPAVSYDLENWEWLGKCEENSFTYTFKANENKVYFAHSMLYHPERFYRLAKELGLEITELCKTKKGRSVPFVTFGNGKRVVLLTARHHACESTGNYVMEGVIKEFIKNPLPDTKVIAVPFVDFDGVIEGDQGKDRTPYDHNRDYVIGEKPIYPEVAAVRKIIEDGIFYGFDFHSPWHFGDESDTLYMCLKKHERMSDYNRFAEIFEKCLDETCFKYKKENNMPPDYLWNKSDAATSCVYMNDIGKAKLAFSLETMYFGTEDNIFDGERAVNTGKAFVRALREYDKGNA